MESESDMSGSGSADATAAGSGIGSSEEGYGGIVYVDRCTNPKCAGVYFDGGELEILLKAKSSLLKRILGG